MKYAVEARIFDNGRIVTKVRPAEDGETNHSVYMANCSTWVDVFDNENEARQFSLEYKKA